MNAITRSKDAHKAKELALETKKWSTLATAGTEENQNSVFAYSKWKQAQQAQDEHQVATGWHYTIGKDANSFVRTQHTRFGTKFKTMVYPDHQDTRANQAY